MTYGLDDMTNAQQICIPHMHDLLSRPMAHLRGHPLEALTKVLDHFHLTLSENTNAIQASLKNIVRAPIRLAEKFQPVIEELIAAQASSSDASHIGESSRRNNFGHEGDLVHAHTGNTLCCLQIDSILFKIYNSY